MPACCCSRCTKNLTVNVCIMTPKLWQRGKKRIESNTDMSRTLSYSLSSRSCILIFYGWMVLYLPTALMLNISPFCPYSVLVCFILLLEQTLIISLISINRLIFVMVKCSVPFAVRTAFLNVTCSWNATQTLLGFWVIKRIFQLNQISPLRYVHLSRNINKHGLRRAT